MYNRKSKSFHPIGKTEQFIEQGNSIFGNMCCLILAGIVVIWLCKDTSANLDASIHHYDAHRDAGMLSLLWEWVQ